MTAHCPGCHCRDVEPGPPATSSTWARRAALDAASEAVRRAKDRRLPRRPAATTESERER